MKYEQTIEKNGAKIQVWAKENAIEWSEVTYCCKDTDKNAEVYALDKGFRVVLYKRDGAYYHKQFIDGDCASYAGACARAIEFVSC